MILHWKILTYFYKAHEYRSHYIDHSFIRVRTTRYGFARSNSDMIITVAKQWRHVERLRLLRGLRKTNGTISCRFIV